MARDTLAEWLRRRPAKPMCSARVGSNPIGVEFCYLAMIDLHWLEQACDAMQHATLA